MTAEKKAIKLRRGDCGFGVSPLQMIIQTSGAQTSQIFLLDLKDAHSEVW